MRTTSAPCKNKSAYHFYHWLTADSQQLGQYFATTAGAAGVALGILFFGFLSKLPNDAMDMLGVSSLLLLFVIGNLFILPAVAAGVLLLLYRRHIAISPVMVAAITIAAIGIGAPVDHSLTKMTRQAKAMAEQNHAIQRTLSIKDAVERMNLDSSEKMSMQQSLEAMSDESLCNALVLPRSHCAPYMGQPN